MYRYITILLLVAILQNPVLCQIDKNILLPNWKLGTQKVIHGNTIFRIEGSNDIGGITNIGYRTYDQLIKESQKKADEEMWPKSKLDQHIEYLNSYAQGGEVYLYITRLTIDAANTEWFTIIIKDETDTNEIYRIELDEDIPEVPSYGSRYWWNYSSVSIPEKVNGTFYVYVIDQISSRNKRHKFQVNIK